MTEHFDPSIDMDLFYENQEAPWWWYRCLHREHAYWLAPDGTEYGCWRVLQEAEGVVILGQVCLSRVHILVDLAGVAGVCKTLTKLEYEAMTEEHLMALVQTKRRELKSLQRMQE